MPIYTKKGDSGKTDLCNGDRVKKSSDIIKTLGDLDELNAFLGLARVILAKSSLKNITLVQNDLFILGSVIAGVKLDKKKTDYLAGRVVWMEKEIDILSRKLAELKNFILPDGCEVSARVHVARVICRRCERSLIYLNKFTGLIPYLNRLSDYLFVLALYENHKRGVKDVAVTSNLLL